MIAALFVDANGIYAGRPDVDLWPKERDARRYSGPWPVVAHPPCQLWTNMAAVNWKRYGRDRPAWYPGGDDGGCFAFALAAVRCWGGVLEHPASTHAWAAHGLPRPPQDGWQVLLSAGPMVEAVCDVAQVAYGHKARKRTWLFYAGPSAPTMIRTNAPTATHQIGQFDRIKPTLSGRAASATPPAFAELLLSMARNVPAGEVEPTPQPATCPTAATSRRPQTR